MIIRSRIQQPVARALRTIIIESNEVHLWLASAEVSDTIEAESVRSGSNGRIYRKRELEMLMLALSWTEIGFAAIFAYALLSIIVVKK